MTLSRQIAVFAAEARFEDLSPLAVERTQWSLLDMIGVVLAASSLGEGCDAFIALAREYRAADEASVLGCGFRTSAPMAALANGAMAHAMDFEDSFDASPLHPNSASIPAVLALAQRQGGVSGKDLLTALAVGCDLTCRPGLALRADPAQFGWYTPAILGAIGAAAAAGRLLELDAEAMTDALSLVLCQSSCSAELKRSPNSTVRAVRDGFGAQAGLLSAVLAKKGVKGFDLPLEGQAGLFQLFTRIGPDESALLEGLGRKFHGEDTSYKVWPSCRGTHALIEAAQLLRREHGVRPDQIAAFVVHGGSIQRMLCEPLAQKQRPRTAIDAKFSLFFTVAHALRHPDVTLDSFTAEALNDPDTLALAAQGSFAIRDSGGGGADGELDLILRDGRRLSRFVPSALGSPANPVTRARIVEKFFDCARRARAPMRDTAIAATVETVLTLEQTPDATRALSAAGVL